jgi:hypothetical protein
MEKDAQADVAAGSAARINAVTFILDDWCLFWFSIASSEKNNYEKTMLWQTQVDRIFWWMGGWASYFGKTSSTTVMTLLDEKIIMMDFMILIRSFRFWDSDSHRSFSFFSTKCLKWTIFSLSLKITVIFKSWLRNTSSNPWIKIKISPSSATRHSH